MSETAQDVAADEAADLGGSTGRTGEAPRLTVARRAESEPRPNGARPARRARTAAGRVGASERVTQAVLAGLLVAALGAGLVLKPNPDGVDTHTQLGLPPCGMYQMTGKPCPTCGVTTSFVLAVHGRFKESFLNQPFGFVCFLLVVGGLGSLIATLALGRSWGPFFARVNPVFILVILGMILLASWMYKWSIM